MGKPCCHLLKGQYKSQAHTSFTHSRCPAAPNLRLLCMFAGILFAMANLLPLSCPFTSLATFFHVPSPPSLPSFMSLHLPRYLLLFPSTCCPYYIYAHTIYMLPILPPSLLCRFAGILSAVGIHLADMMQGLRSHVPPSPPPSSAGLQASYLPWISTYPPTPSPFSPPSPCLSLQVCGHPIRSGYPPGRHSARGPGAMCLQPFTRRSGQRASA